MKNKYKKLETHIILYLDKKDGSRHECLINNEDFNRVIEFPHKWYSAWYERTQSYYCQASIYIPKGQDKKSIKRTVFLQRFIMQVDDDADETVDHISHDTLDNRRENLRVITKRNNSTYRCRANKNNKSGYRNVCWIKNKWVVQLQVKGKNTVLGKFDDVHEAGKFAEEMRQKHYGEFAGWD